MVSLRYQIRTDWLFYLLVLSYAYLVCKMTFALWFGGGINIFASYSDAATASEMIVDANKVYWSKTCFLFGTLLLFGLNVDIRAAAGLGASFWATSLMVMFGTSPTLIAALVIGLLLVGQQIFRGAFFAKRKEP